MKRSLIYLLILTLFFLFGLVGCEEEETEGEENGDEEGVEVTPGTFETEVGEWVTYSIEEGGEVTLALVSMEEYEGVPGYWIEIVAPIEEGENVIVKVLIEKEAYEEFGDEVMGWLNNPELPEEGFLAEAMSSMEGMGGEAAMEEMQAGMEEFSEIVMRLIVEAEGQAFEIDLPSIMELVSGQMVAGMEMAEEMEEAYGGEVEPEEIEMPSFELVRGVPCEAGGKTYPCNMILVTHEDETAEVYFSTKVPFFGLVKVVAEEEEKLVLLDYGRSGYESQLTVAEPMMIDANTLMMMFMGSMMMEGGMGGMPEGMEGMRGMEGMDPEMLEALEALERMGG
ncbi:hypothetical protein KAU45_00450 [bacterium]|nr:hypothetical protein [bacterium]